MQFYEILADCITNIVEITSFRIDLNLFDDQLTAEHVDISGEPATQRNVLDVVCVSESHSYFIIGHRDTFRDLRRQERLLRDSRQVLQKRRKLSREKFVEGTLRD